MPSATYQLMRVDEIAREAQIKFLEQGCGQLDHIRTKNALDDISTDYMNTCSPADDGDSSFSYGEYWWNEAEPRDLDLAYDGFHNAVLYYWGTHAVGFSGGAYEVYREASYALDGTGSNDIKDRLDALEQWCDQRNGCR